MAFRQEELYYASGVCSAWHLVKGFGLMHLVSRLRRTLAMMTVLLGLLADLGVASAQADAPIHTGGGGSSDPSRS